ncbi:BREX system serine/threonine kinase PglW [Streptomyces sp. NBC_01762]|uniref:BREX system serine/threonine kinase PglW n=1 Tax=unclassified Streptomyces TaxID=2593676 RepID=UPI002DDA2266|nr:MULTISPECIES: BREX system serine/threonine kinase PglW [unclassified Streptomyces]WSC49489.1 BREX system serine/threonine kinase PglW [Streptomyces sp. NBC_01762]WSD29061.1 BREX system serine/threonine kinase PglW [Streptomyces sp. NBC_01751]
MLDGRWTTVTESGYEHERRGLEAIRKRLPDEEPWRAWSNFSFTASSGHVREVDLLVVAPAGVFLVELKDWHGSVHGGGNDWVQTTPNGTTRRHGNPLHLSNQKAKELAGLVNGVAGRPGDRSRIWVGEAVCFTDDRLQVQLPAADMNGVFTVKKLVEMLAVPPGDGRRRVTAETSRRVDAALKQLRIAPIRRQHEVGSYLLDAKAFDSGPTWADYLGRHSQLQDLARVRVFLSERGASDEERRSVERAAAREAAILSRFKHPGAVQLKTYLPSGHPAGPAILFDYHPETLRLDDYLVQHGERLDLQGRLALVRQLAETVRSAHSRRIHHRTLSAHSVHVIPRDRGPRGRELGEEQRWLRPWPQIADWQIATGQSVSRGRPLTLAPTNVSGVHVSGQADPYLAPELRIPKADPVRLDVYGLGVLTYLLVTGQAPGASQSEVMARLEGGETLRPSALVDGLHPDVDDLVEASTAYEPGRRLSTVDDFLEMLEYVEQAFVEEIADSSDAAADAGGDGNSGSAASDGEEQTKPEKDPLEAVAGDVLGRRWEVVRRLGTGSTSRAFLVRDLEGEPRRSGALPVAVLKVALSEAKHTVLDREADVLGRIHRDSSIIALYEREPLTLAGRRVLVLDYVGDSRELKDQDASADKGPRRREDTVARQLRDNGRLGMDQLEAYGKYLFGAVEHLEAEGIWHRDLKPDNIAIRIRPNGTRQLVLIDFSLAGYPAKEIEAGTEGYLDPFVGIITRGSYDGHAERYALAVTLHEMAANELPRWGDGSVTPRQTDAKEWPFPQLAADAFEPAVRDGLVAFFRKALARDVKDRFSDLKPMERAWQRIFLDAQRTTAPSSGHSEKPSRGAKGGADAVAQPATEPRIGREDDDVSAEQVRDQQAERADRKTPLSVAGLTVSAQSQLFAMGLNNVGDVLEYSAKKFLTAPGMGSRTREEIQRRQKEWNVRLGKAAPSPLSAAALKAANQERTALERAAADAIAAAGVDVTAPQVLSGLSLDALAARLVPRPSGGNARSNAKEREAVRLLLRLPDDEGRLPDGLAWVRQRDVAEAVGLTAGRIPQIVKKARERWYEDAALGLLRDELVELLAERGRVAPVIELADALIVRRGTQHVERRDRRALALSLLRALVERESRALVERESGDDESPQLFRYFHARMPKGADPVLGLLALDVREGVDGPDTPSLPALQEYALNLGARADRLAALESLPTASTVLTELDAVRRPLGSLGWDERRTAEIAVAASTRAALTPRLEIYPRDLDLVRALRITQAGVVAVQPGVEEDRLPGLTVDALHKRVATRFPDLGTDPLVPRELPTGSALVRALKEAGFELKLATRYDKVLRLVPDRRSGDATAGLTSASWGASAARRSAPTQYDADAAVAAAVKANQRLTHSARQDGFRVLTVPQRRAEDAVRWLTGEPFGARPVSLTGLFVDELRSVVGEAARPTWETVLKADAAEPGSRPHQQLRIRTDKAWGRIEPRLRERLAGARGPLLLTDTAVLARYDALDLLGQLAEEARQGGNPLWLLVAQSDPARAPRLAGQSVPYQAGFDEWIVVPDAWVARKHLALDA